MKGCIKLCQLIAGMLLVFALGGCGDNSGGGSSSGGTALDPDVAAITGGEWYRPAVGVTWQWQLQGALNTSYEVDIYDIDLFETSATQIANLQAAGRKVICYFSAGSYENYREDKGDFPAETLGNTLDGWDDERWLDIRHTAVHYVMKKRLDLAQEKGCDGVEPDNMDGYINDPGFNLTAKDQLAYNRFIGNEAHKRGLSVGLKNDLDQISQLVDYYDFSVNEQCFEYNECDTLEPFIDAGKPVLNAEYKSDYVNNTSGARDVMCAESLVKDFSSLVLPLDLDDSSRYSCL